MSRLLINNIPVNATPIRLRQHFEQKGGPGGIITDVKVAQKPNGTSRRFGFIGFKTDAEAAAAKEWFDRTYMDSSRISVILVDGARDAPTPRPNKRPRLGPSPVEAEDFQSKSKNSATTKSSTERTNTDLDQYIELSKSRAKAGPIWANDSAPLTSAKKMPVRPASSGTNESEGEQCDDENPPEDSSRPDALSDLEWMRRRMSTQVDRHAEKEDDNDDPQAAQRERLPVHAEPEGSKQDPIETIRQTSRLFLRNLSYSCTEEEIEAFFSPFGTIKQVHIPVDPSTKQHKGMAYVTFVDPSPAVAAFKALDKTSFQGRLVHILPAVDRRGNFAVEEAPGHKTLKDERNAKRKATASKEFNWSMLYMNSDAVASSIADRMNISKSDILNPDSDSQSSAAVKLALAETHIIQEIKTYLETHGVILSSFSARGARSDTTILVKNIPYGTTEEQITEMFQPHGTLVRVLVPPAGTMAVVEFEHAVDAKSAFKAIAYRRLGNSVIYLEKGPLGMFQDTSPTLEGDAAQQPGPRVTATAVTIPEQDQLMADGDKAEDEPSLSAGSTLYVKNLAFSTTTDKLVQVFGSLPSFSFARVQMKPDPKRPGAKLSMGYGFVGFKDVDGAKKAMKSMQGFNLDGHALHVKFAGRGTEGDEAAKDGDAAKRKKSETTTKMIVKNVPFEASKKDIRQLFGAHGQLKSVRLPKKLGSRTRGFAFLEFTTRREAENAYATLRYTHLLGRHLVLEWAKDDATNTEEVLEEMRKKAGVGYGDGKSVPGKKGKVRVGEGPSPDEGDEEM